MENLKMVDDMWEADVVEYEPDYIDEDSLVDDWFISEMEKGIGFAVIDKEK